MKDCWIRKHDYKNPIRKGRAYYVCPKCNKDITLELFLLIWIK
jgi:transposase-like protein